jgi:hypothetical protein
MNAFNELAVASKISSRQDSVIRPCTLRRKGDTNRASKTRSSSRSNSCRLEIICRLHVPYYEEARRYFAEARADGHLDGVNEVALYMEDTLKSIVDKYGR